jgi:hypothetical protein
VSARFWCEPCSPEQFAELLMIPLHIARETQEPLAQAEIRKRPALSQQRRRGLRLLAYWWRRGIEQQTVKRANDHDFFEENVT